MTKLKQTEYKTIEIAEDESYGMVVGNIVMDGNKMHYAEIVGGTICNHEELANIRAFLDDVEETMETETMHTVSNVGCETEVLPDNFWNVVCQKDIIIKQQSNAIEEYKEAIRVERIDHDAERETIITKFSEDLRKKNAIIEELKDKNADDLNELYALDKAELSSMKYNYELILQNRRDRGDKLEDNIKGLEDELSARKQDSEVLEKVVEIVGDNRIYPYGAMYELSNLLVDYLDSDSVGNVAGSDTSCTVDMDIRCE